MYDFKISRYIPLLVLPIYNAIFLKTLYMDFRYTLTMFGAVILEELVYRVFLLKIFGKWNQKFGFWISNILFSIAHFANIKEDEDITYVAMQVIMAFFVGICFSSVVLLTGHIIPCVIIHFLINITAFGEREFGIGIWVCIVWYAVYGMVLYKKINFTKGKENETLY